MRVSGVAPRAPLSAPGRRAVSGARAALPTFLALRGGLGVALALLALPLLLTWPLALHLGSQLPGDRPADALIHTHQLWWVARALSSLSNPYQSPIILYPDGARLYFETLVPLDGLLAWAPLRLFGPLVAYNLVLLLMLAANGLAAWALATRVAGSRSAGAVGALVYAASPYLLNHVRTGHLGVVSACWAPLALLGLLNALRTRRPGWIILAGGALAAAAYTDLQAGLALALLAALLLVREVLIRPRQLAGSIAVLGASGALALALAAPLLAGALDEARQGAGVIPPERYAVRNSADLLAFISPSPLHPLWGGAMRAWYHQRQLDLEDEAVVYPGLAALALAALGLRSRATRRPFWAVAALLLAALSLGPLLHLGGPDGLLALPGGIPTPYALLQVLPYVAIGRTPARFMGMAMLCLALLAAQGVVTLREWLRWPALAAPLAALLVGFEFLSLPFPLSTPHVPGGYQYLVQQGCRGPILELPVDAGGADQKARLFFQTLHGCPISGGYRARGGDQTSLGALWRRVARQGETTSPLALRLGERVRRLGFQYVVLWKPAYESAEERRRDDALVAALFPGPPVFEDAETAVYQVGD